MTALLTATSINGWDDTGLFGQNNHEVHLPRVRAREGTARTGAETLRGPPYKECQSPYPYAGSTLQHREVKGAVQTIWRAMVVDEVTRLHRERLHVNGICQGNQGMWT